MAGTPTRMIPLGYGKFVRADRIYAVVPLDGEERGDGRRTLVHVEGLADPLLASRSERAILAVLEDAAGTGAEGFLLGGDYALFGPWPRETVERLRELPGARWLRGNVDRWT